MNSKVKYVLGAVVAIAISYAAGRYSAPEKVRTETKIVEVEKKSKKTETETEKNKETKIVEVTYPDGRKEVTTIITEGSTKKKKEDEKTKSERDETASTEITRSRGKLHLQGLAGLDKLSLAGKPLYGASVSKEVLGPISVGAWGLTNSTFGVSLGLSF